MIHAFIKKGCFQDSVSLMIISRKLSESENVDDVSVMMGTPANKALLDTTGFWHDDFNNATPNDICVAIRSEAADAGIAQAIMQQLEEALKQLAQGSGSSQALTPQIITRAREHGVYVHESPELVSLLMQVDLDQRIPAQLYVVVAELLAWIYRLESGQAITATPVLSAIPETIDKK